MHQRSRGCINERPDLTHDSTCLKRWTRLYKTLLNVSCDFDPLISRHLRRPCAFYSSLHEGCRSVTPLGPGPWALWEAHGLRARLKKGIQLIPLTKSIIITAKFDRIQQGSDDADNTTGDSTASTPGCLRWEPSTTYQPIYNTTATCCNPQPEGLPRIRCGEIT